MIDYLFLYEHKAREMESICLLKAALEEKGYSVDVIQLYELNMFPYRFRMLKKPKVMITFAQYNDMTFKRMVTDIVGDVRKVVNMHWEQSLSQNNIDTGYPIPSGNAAKAVHICWGNVGYDLLKSNNIKNAVVTGAIQMDFLRNEFKEIYYSRDEIDKKYHLPKGKMILYISTFVYASMTEDEQVIFENYVGYSVANRVEYNKKNRKKTLEWLLQFIDENPEYFVIYRPHPGENVDAELRQCEENNRFFVTSDDSIKQWIVVADEIITYYSTSIAEVYYAKKNCIVLRPYPMDKGEDALLFENACFITSYENLVCTIKSTDRKFPVPIENITDCYGEMTDIPAYKNYLKLLEDVRNTDQYDIKERLGGFNIKDPLRRFIKSMLLILHPDLDNHLIKRSKWLEKKFKNLYYAEEKLKQDYVSKQEIDNKVQLYKNVLKLHESGVNR